MGPGASGQPASDATGLFGATTQAFVEPFTDHSIWFTGDSQTNTFAYQGDAYAVDIKGDGSGSWSWRTLPEAHPVLRIEGTLDAQSGLGAGGYMCGAPSGDQSAFVFGDVTSGGEWVMGTIAGTTVTVRSRGPLAAGSDLTSGATTITLECAMTADGGDRAVMSVDGSKVAEIQLADVIGPFDRVAVYAGDVHAPFTAVFDDLSAFVGDARAGQVGDPAAASEPDASQLPSGTPGPTTPPTPAPTQAPSVAPSVVPGPSMSPAQQALLARVPSALRDGCGPADPLANTQGQLAGITCRPAGAADVAWYYAFDSVATMDTAFDAFRPAGLTGHDCKVGASLVTYQIAGQPAGRLACYPNTGSEGAIQFQWTDEQLRILAFGQLGSGSYPDLYGWWLDGGPDR